jgi:thiol-disulfide isomerase/thioredoxin
MKKIILFLLSCILLSTTYGAESSERQILQKMVKALNGLESFGCSMVYRSLEDESDTTAHPVEVQYFKNNADTLLGYSFVMTDGKVKHLYDGSYLVFLKDDLKFVNINDDAEGITRILSSFWCSPLSIKRVLGLCLSSDSVKYHLDRDAKNNYRLKLELPYFNLDGYLPLDMPKMPGQKTEYELIFDNVRFLPIYQYRNNVGMMKFTALFENFHRIPTKPVVALDSIPKGYRTDADMSIETDLKNVQAPGFTLKQFEGDSVDLYKLDRNYTLLEFTNLNCGPCRRAARFLKEYYSKGVNKRLEILLIDDESRTNRKSLSTYLTESKLPFRYLMDGDSIAKKYKVSAVPTFFLLDKNKRIVDVNVGFSEERLRALLEKTNE